MTTMSFAAILVSSFRLAGFGKPQNYDQRKVCFASEITRSLSDEPQRGIQEHISHTFLVLQTETKESLQPRASIISPTQADRDWEQAPI
jgi:hypothetical protein